MAKDQRGRRALKPQICRPLQVLPSGYTTMCGQRSSRAIAFYGERSKVSDESGSKHLHDHVPRSACTFGARTIISAALEPLFLSSRSTKIVCCDIISWIAPHREACRARQSRGAGSINAQNRCERETHVAHDGEAHVLRSRHAHRQAAPQEKPDVREALRTRKQCAFQRWSSPHFGDSARLVVAHDDGRLLTWRSLAGDGDVLKSQREQVQANEVRQRGLLQPAPGGAACRVRRDATGADAMPRHVALCGCAAWRGARTACAS